MEFFDITVPQALTQLKEHKKPEWGTLTATEMLLHLTTGLKFSLTPELITITTPEDKLPKSKAFLMSEHPMPKNFEQPEAFSSATFSRTSFDAAKNLFLKTLKKVLNETKKPNFESVHPNFGRLNGLETQQLHRKHITHHFTQFGII